MPKLRFSPFRVSKVVSQQTSFHFRSVLVSYLSVWSPRSLSNNIRDFSHVKLGRMMWLRVLNIGDGSSIISHSYLFVKYSEIFRLRDFRRPILPLRNLKCYFETRDVTGCERARREAENYEL